LGLPQRISPAEIIPAHLLRMNFAQFCTFSFSCIRGCQILDDWSRNMPKSVNKVILVGNVGKDPEVKYSPSGTPVAKFSLATNEKYKDRSDEWQERTEWHNFVAWQRLAEIVGE
jgi:hypothetical protein